MKDYKEFTFGWLIFAFLIPIHIVITYLYINQIGDKPMGTTAYIIVSMTFLVIYVLFYGMLTTVSSETIRISFGIGIIQKNIELNTVKDVEKVKSPWYYGWGIRIIPNGMLYNISGFDGVELKFKDTKRIIRLGTKDSTKLKSEIEERLT